ncbi:MAG: hypothetical protein GY710_18500 [Desulfobacteraceae bacterium]|nr:hypothetical protein [Desulfobacteraceae bacterium]
MISFIEDMNIIEKILRHLDLWGISNQACHTKKEFYEAYEGLGVLI